MKGLTKQQAKVLEFITLYIEKHRFSPTYRDIMSHFSFRSPASVHKHVFALQRKGYITHEPGTARSMQPIDRAPSAPHTTKESEIPLIGTLSTEKAIQLFAQSQSVVVPARMVQNPEKTYVLRIEGMGFAEELLSEGDWLIVEARGEVHDGEAVIALINAQVALIKRYFLEEEYVRLEGVQPGYQPIILHQNDIAIHGIIKGVMRTYSG